MEITYEEYEWKKILIENKKIRIPEEPIYFFLFGVRLSFAIIPEWTSWQLEHHNKPEEVWQLQIICVDTSLQTIEKGTLRISNISDIATRDKRKSIIDHAFFYLKHDYTDGEPHREQRTRDQFLKDYSYVLEKYNEFLKIEQS